MDVEKHLRLTHAGAMKLIEAGVRKAVEMKKPQCIAVFDAGCHLRPFTGTDGGKELSIESAIRQAQTASSGRGPTGGIQGELEFRLAHATSGRLVHATRCLAHD